MKPREEARTRWPWHLMFIDLNVAFITPASKDRKRVRVRWNRIGWWALAVTVAVLCVV
jgi:hypothetical protein